MAEFDMIFTHSYTTLEYEPKVINLIMQETCIISGERVPRVYNQFTIFPVINEITDENGNSTSFEREVREWDVVLPFGVASNTPRVKPTELIYKGKRMKNKFTV